MEITPSLAWTVSIAFMIIVALTLVNVFNVQPFIKYCAAPERYRDKLFTVLILEIIAVCLGIVGAGVHKYQYNKETVKKLEFSLEAWEKASRSFLNEPSGLSISGLSSGALEGDILVSVDDNESAVFVLNTHGKSFPLVRAMLKLVGKDHKDIADDLEEITYDGSKYYYALGSHRRLGDDPKAVETRKLVRFQIDSEAWKSGYGEIIVEDAIDLTSLPNGSLGLGQLLQKYSIPVSNEQWGKRNEQGDQEYALELEGLASYGGKLFVGMRYPLDKGAAVLLSFNPTDMKFDGFWRLNLSDKGVEQGITALTISGNDLIVASNPPQKTPEAYGKSCLWSYPLDKLLDARTSHKPIDGKRLPLEPKVGAKLEGIAAKGEQIFLAFEGDAPYFESINISPR